jgi:hypothetical protein
MPINVRLIPDSWGSTALREANDCHEPAGSPNGGQFCSKGGGGVTQSPAFKQWFKDSKVVDAAGNPLRVYHGTGRNQFDAFSLSTVARSGFGYGFHFSESPGPASAYAEQWDDGQLGGVGQIIPAYLSIQRPFGGDYYTFKYELGESMGTTASDMDVRLALIAKGFDGIVYEHGDKEGRRVKAWVAFHPQQIKSALSNRTFDPTSKKFTEANDCHEPAGSPNGGQFCSKPGFTVPPRDTFLHKRLTTMPVSQVELLGEGISESYTATVQGTKVAWKPESGSVWTGPQGDWVKRRMDALSKGLPFTEPKPAFVERKAIREEIVNTDFTMADREVAAYELDRLLQLYVVPVTVKREVDGQVGSMQEWVTPDPITAAGLESPDGADAWYRVAVLDVIIGNTDRHWGNIIEGRVAGYPKVYAIDNNLSFAQGSWTTVSAAIFEAANAQHPMSEALRTGLIKQIDSVDWKAWLRRWPMSSIERWRVMASLRAVRRSLLDADGFGFKTLVRTFKDSDGGNLPLDTPYNSLRPGFTVPLSSTRPRKVRR